MLVMAVRFVVVMLVETNHNILAVPVILFGYPDVTQVRHAYPRFHGCCLRTKDPVVTIGSSDVFRIDGRLIYER